MYGTHRYKILFSRYRVSSGTLELQLQSASTFGTRRKETAEFATKWRAVVALQLMNVCGQELRERRYCM